ncbi:MAG TPA: CsgG/HfaB family protein [Desulfuromonadaceae bacterium]
MRLCQQLLALLLLALVATAPAVADEFRGKWWHYYERGISYGEEGDFEKAVSDLQTAMRKREKDQRMARTYGMHFIDYFPHRELGVVYLAMGKLDAAIQELEESIRQEETAKAAYFLNKAHREQLLRRGGKHDAPVITITSPAPDKAVREQVVKVKGKVSGSGYIGRLVINGINAGTDLALREMEFEKEVSIDDPDSRIVITAEDLLGNTVAKSVTVHLDTEGPLISIFDVVATDKAGRKYIRITGEVTDATGIRKITVNDRPIAVKDERTFNLDIEQERGGASRLTIKAWDSLDNVTVAEFDLERELVAFGKRPEPVLLAFNGPGIFSSDREPPVITLKDKGDIPELFVDRYYVDGEVSDNNRVDRIMINNRELPVKKGKKIFFGSMVKLNEGKNRINVTAFDAAGNKGSADFSVTRKVPAVMQSGSRMALTVLPFTGKVKDADYAQLADDFLTASLVEQKRFMLIEREKLKQVLAEQKLSKEHLTDPGHSVRLGKLIAADALVATTVREDKKSLEIVSRVINTETSEIMDVKDVFTEDKGHAPVKELMDGLAAKLARSFPMAEGIVLKASGSDIYTDLGSASNVRKGMGLIIYKKGPEIKHPITGKSLGSETVKIAEGHLDEIQKEFSKVKLLEKFRKQSIKATDLVIMK